MISSARSLTAGIFVTSLCFFAVPASRAQSFDWLSGPYGMTGGNVARNNAVDAAIGDAAFRPLWSIDLGWLDNPDYHQPALLDGQRAFVRSAVDGELAAYELTTGSLAWEVSGTIFSVLDFVYHEGQLFGTGQHDDRQWIWCRDARTGELQWERPLDDFGPWPQSMVVNAEGIWFANSGQRNIFHYSLDGFWLQTYRPSDGVLRNFAFDGGHFLAASEFLTRLFDTNSGGLRSSFLFGDEFGETGEMLEYPVLSSGVGLAARSIGPLMALDVENETVAWRQHGTFSGVPAADSSSAYAIRDKFVYRYALQTGELEGRYETPDGPLINQPLVFEDSLIVGSASALHVFRHDLFRLRQSFVPGGMTSYADGYLVGFDGQLLNAYVLDEVPSIPNFTERLDAYQGRALAAQFSMTPTTWSGEIDVFVEGPAWLAVQGPDENGVITLSGTPEGGAETDETVEAALNFRLDDQFECRFPFSLTIRTDPRPGISGLPERFEAFENQSLRLEATVHGAPPMKIQWYRDGEPILNANEPTLLISHLGLTDSGSYVLAAGNDDGEARSTEIEVTVRPRTRGGGPWAGDHRSTPLANAYPGILTDTPFRHLWSIPGERGNVVIGGNLLIQAAPSPSHETTIVTAYDVHSGSQHWQQTFPAIDDVSNEPYQLVLDGEDLFLFLPANPFGDRSGRLIRMQASSGEIAVDAMPGRLRTATLLVDEDAIFFLDQNESRELFLHSLNREDLQERFEPVALGVFDFLPGVPPLAAGGGFTYLVLDGELVAFDSISGERAWGVRVAPSNANPSPSLGGSALVDDLAVVMHRAGVAGVDLRSREVLWERSETLRGLADRQMFLETADGLKALDLGTGAVVQIYRRPTAPLTAIRWETPIITIDRLILPARVSTREATNHFAQIYDRDTGLLESEVPLRGPFAYSNGIMSGWREDTRLRQGFLSVFTNLPEPDVVQWPSGDAAVDVGYESAVEIRDGEGEPLQNLRAEGLPSWLTMSTSTPGVAILRGLPPAGSEGVYRPILMADRPSGILFSRTLELTVWALPAPRVEAEQRSLSVRERGAVVLSASIEGLPPIALQWFHDGEPVPGANATRLTLEAVALDDAGIYRLRASNAFGESQTAEIVVDVLPRQSAQGDWTELGEAAGNTRHFIPITVDPAPPLPEWVLPPDDAPGKVSMASTNGVVAVLSQSSGLVQMSGYALSSGALLWQRPIDVGSTSGFAFGPVAGDGAFVTQLPSPEERVEVWEAATGRLRWRWPIVGTTQARPAIDEESVYVHAAVGRQHRIRRHDSASGDLLWEWENDGGDDELIMAPWEDKLFVLQEGVIYCLDALDGSLVWTIDWSGDDLRSARTRLLVPTHDLLFVDRGLGVEAFDRLTGEVRWRRSGLYSHCVVADTRLYCEQGQALELWDRQTGELLEPQSINIQDSRLIGVQNGLLYQLESQSGVWFHPRDQEPVLLSTQSLSGFLDGYLVTESAAGWNFQSLLPYRIEEPGEAIAYTAVSYRLEPSVISAQSGNADSVPDYRIEMVEGPAWLELEENEMALAGVPDSSAEGSRNPIRLRFRFDDGEVIDHWMVLEVQSPEPVVIAAPPDRVALAPGQSFRIEPGFTGRPPFQFQWTKDGALIPGATEPTYTITDFRPEDAGDYGLRILNDYDDTFVFVVISSDEAPSSGGWTMRHGGPSRSRSAADFVDVDAVTERWNVSLQGFPLAEPLIADGAVYLASENETNPFLAVYDLDSGELLWQADNLGREASLPIYAEGAVVMHQLGDERTEMVARDVQGQVLWEQITAIGRASYETPFAIEKNLFLTAGEPTIMNVFSAETGALSLSVPVDFRIREPLIAGEGDALFIIHRTSTDELIRVNASTGETEWRVLFDVPEVWHVAYDHPYVLVRIDESILALDAETGRELWSKRVIHGDGLAVDGEAVTFVEQGNLYRIRISDGEELARCEPGLDESPNFISWPVVVGDLVFAGLSDGNTTVLSRRELEPVRMLNSGGLMAYGEGHLVMAGSGRVSVFSTTGITGNLPSIDSTPVRRAIEDEVYEYLVAVSGPGEPAQWMLSLEDDENHWLAVERIDDERFRLHGVPPYPGVEKDVELTLRNGSGGETTQRFSIKIEPANDPPRLIQAIPELILDEDWSRYFFPVLTYVQDEDLGVGQLQIEAVVEPAEAGTVERIGDELLFRPGSDFFGPLIVRLTVRDPQGLMLEVPIAVTIQGFPDAPVAIGGLERIDMEGDEGSLRLTNFFTDPDGEPLNYSVMSMEGEAIQTARVDEGGEDLQLVATPYLSGQARVRIEATDPTGRSVAKEFTIVVPELIAPEIVLETPVLNPQSGFLEQRLEATNNGLRTIGGFEVLLSSADPGARLINANGETESGYLVRHAQPLAPGDSVTLHLEWYSPEREWTGIEEVEVTLVLPVEGEAGSHEGAFAIQRLIRLEDGGILIEWEAEAGSRYEVQYSDEAAEWLIVSPVVVTTNSRMQWIDRGPPKTQSPPEETRQRLYRLRRLEP